MRHSLVLASILLAAHEASATLIKVEVLATITDVSGRDLPGLQNLGQATLHYAYQTDQFPAGLEDRSAILNEPAYWGAHRYVIELREPVLTLGERPHELRDRAGGDGLFLTDRQASEEILTTSDGAPVEDVAHATVFLELRSPGLAAIRSLPDKFWPVRQFHEITRLHAEVDWDDGQRTEVIAEVFDWVWTEYETGDANKDGRFDQLDVVTTLIGGKYQPAEVAVWSEGDWNGDGRFTQLDLVEALKTNTYRVAPDAALSATTAVPEPSTIFLAGLGAITIAVCLMQKQTMRPLGG